MELPIQLSWNEMKEWCFSHQTIVAAALVGFTATTLLVTLFPFTVNVTKIRSRRKKPSQDTWESHIKPHTPLKQIHERLWLVNGDILGIKDIRTMIVYKMNNGGLFIHSAIAMNEEEMRKLEALGTPEILVVPNVDHRADAGVYKQRYPSLVVVCPKNAKVAVEEIVKVDKFAEDIFGPGNTFGIDVHSPPLTFRNSECIYEVELGDKKKALIANDALFNVDSRTLKFFSFARFWAWLVGINGTGVQPSISVTFAFLCYRSKPEIKKFWNDLADYIDTCTKNGITFHVLTMSHGLPIYDDISDKLRIMVKHYPDK